MKRAKELAEQHWGYVKEVLRTSGMCSEAIDIIGFHYVSSAIHFYGHGWENCEKEMSK